MSDALENKAVEILDKSQAAVATFADKLGDMAKQYGPEVADAALTMARIDAVNYLLISIISGVICLALYHFVVRRLWVWSLGYKDKERFADGSEYIPTVLASIVLAFFSSVVIFRLFNLWAWVGVFEPKLWIAKKVLGL